jgi:hypothetical protein
LNALVDQTRQIKKTECCAERAILSRKKSAKKIRPELPPGRASTTHQHLHHEETTSFIILIQEDDNY